MHIYIHTNATLPNMRIIQPIHHPSNSPPRKYTIHPFIHPSIYSTTNEPPTVIRSPGNTGSGANSVRGMAQKEQKETVRKFRDVCTPSVYS